MWTRLVEWAARVRAFVDRRALDRDFDEELESHLAMLDGGQRPARDDCTRRQGARRSSASGIASRPHSATASSRGLPTLDAVLQDVRYAIRSLRTDLGFTVFAVADRRARHRCQRHRLQRRQRHPASPAAVSAGGPPRHGLPTAGLDGVSGRTVPMFHFTDLRDRSRSFSDIGAYMAFYGVGDSKLTGAGEPQRLSGVPVSQNFFSVLGVRPHLGRTFNAEECRFNGPKAVMLGYAFWRDKFASDPDDRRAAAHAERRARDGRRRAARIVRLRDRCSRRARASSCTSRFRSPTRPIVGATRWRWSGG